MLSSDIRLFTWIDVEAVIMTNFEKGECPEWIVWVRAYWDGLFIGIRLDKKEGVLNWLSEIFDPRFDIENQAIILESLQEGTRFLSVIIEETDENTPSYRFKPSLRRPPLLCGIPQRRKLLAEFSKKLIYAETGTQEVFLSIPPLRHLASDYLNKIPVCVVIGAKGAGKTYTYLQVVVRHDWARFAKDVGVGGSPGSALICPVMKSKNIESETNRRVLQTRNEVVRALKCPPAPELSEVSDHIKDNLDEELYEGKWRVIWIDWKDRILIPTAIRSALQVCSEEKIEEISIENSELKRIFIKLRELSQDHRQIPFVREEVDLTIDQIQALEKKRRGIRRKGRILHARNLPGGPRIQAEGRCPSQGPCLVAEDTQIDGNGKRVPDCTAFFIGGVIAKSTG